MEAGRFVVLRKARRLVVAGSLLGGGKVRGSFAQMAPGKSDQICSDLLGRRSSRKLNAIFFACLERERANDFLVSESKKHPEVQGLVCTAPVIDLGPHAICNLSAQTSKQADRTRTILDVLLIQDKTHLQTFVKAGAGNIQFALLRTSRLVRYDDLSSRLSLASDLSLTTT
jgi:hypothetical protein